MIDIHHQKGSFGVFALAFLGVFVSVREFNSAFAPITMVSVNLFMNMLTYPHSMEINL